ncbi:MAG: hypothetical protein ACYC91_16345 [Solirubrobacteraceae bacterium]
MTTPTETHLTPAGLATLVPALSYVSAAQIMNADARFRALAARHLR